MCGHSNRCCPPSAVWVEQAKPGTAAKARQFLLAASGMAVWAYQSFGNTDPTVVFHPSKRRTMDDDGLCG